MRDVMMKAQELAETIADSELYLKMKQAEGAVRRDEEASGLLDDMIAKRQRVENILSSFRHDGNVQQECRASCTDSDRKANLASFEVLHCADSHIDSRQQKPDSGTSFHLSRK